MISFLWILSGDVSISIYMSNHIYTMYYPSHYHYYHQFQMNPYIQMIGCLIEIHYIQMVGFITKIHLLSA